MKQIGIFFPSYIFVILFLFLITIHISSEAAESTPSFYMLIIENLNKYKMETFAYFENCVVFYKRTRTVFHILSLEDSIW